MQRCPREHADVRLDTWGWRCAQLDEAQTIHRTLAGSTGATWPDWSATVHRLAREAASPRRVVWSPGGEEDTP